MQRNRRALFEHTRLDNRLDTGTGPKTKTGLNLFIGWKTAKDSKSGVVLCDVRMHIIRILAGASYRPLPHPGIGQPAADNPNLRNSMRGRVAALERRSNRPLGTMDLRR